MKKKCETCEETAVRGLRYCKGCKSALLSSIKGQLTTVPTFKNNRSAEQMECVRETKFGTGH
jgi:hypothetical protein